MDLAAITCWKNRNRGYDIRPDLESPNIVDIPAPQKNAPGCPGAFFWVLFRGCGSYSGVAGPVQGLPGPIQGLPGPVQGSWLGLVLVLVLALFAPEEDQEDDQRRGGRRNDHGDPHAAGSRLTGLRLKDVNTGAERDLACDGVFISVGRAPATELFRSELALDSSGYIVADDSTRTSLSGVFAAGDVRTKALRQVVTAVSDGAVAVHFAERYLAEKP